MRKPSLRILVGLAFLVWLVCLSGAPLLPPGTEANSNLFASAVSNELEVVVLFEGKAPMRIQDIEQQAINALSTNGDQTVGVTDCGINIVVSGKSSGCATILQDLPRNWLYVVEFNSKGVCRVTSSGKVRHRTPRFGEHVEELPKDVIKVEVEPE
jgi:hypothetical protein